MAQQQPGIWGIDIGQCALKAIRLQQIEGVVTATAFDYVEHPKVLSQPDADPEQLTREALEQFLSRNSLKGDQVAISVPGQSGLVRFVKLPPVEEKKIIDIVKFEAKQQIPFPLEEVVWDYQKIGAGIVTDGFAMETEIGLFAMKRDMINRYLNFFSSVNVEVYYVQMTPLALCNFVGYDLLKRTGKIGAEGDVPPEDDPLADGNDAKGKQRCVVALDMGTDGSNLVITDGARIIWQRPIPVGGNHFTRALTKEMKLTFAKAEHLKRNAAKSPDLAKILKALKPVLTDFVNEVQRSLGYFTNTHRDAHVSYMVGLGNAFRLPGLQKYLAEKLQLEVRKPTKFERISGEDVLGQGTFAENLLSFPVAYGLAIQGLGLSRLQTNLLPPEITFDRKVRAKKPWAAAAAASVLFGTTVLAMGYSVNYSAVHDKAIAEAMEKASRTLKKVADLDAEIQKKREEADKTKEDVKTIIAGQDERLNWIRLNEFINACLPTPPMGNIPANIPDRYYQTREGKIAIDNFQRRLREGIDPLASNNDPTRVDLPMVDVETVYCQYTDNLKQFFDNAEAELKTKKILLSKQDEAGMLPEDYSAPPEGAGWVVEIRGVTYHKGGRQFIKDTLLRNIQFGPPPSTRSRFANNRTSNVKPGTGKPENQPVNGEGADPIRDRITHAFLYDCIEVKPVNGNYQTVMIGSSIIARLTPPKGAGSSSAGTDGFGGPDGPGGPMPPGGLGGDTGGRGGPGFGAGAGGWVPLGMPGASGSGNFGGMDGPSFPGSDGGRPPGMQLPNSGTGPSPGSTPPATSGRQLPSRWEFVVVFIWREPTETPPAESDSSASGGGSSTPSMPAGPMPPGGMPPAPPGTLGGSRGSR